MKTGTCRGCGAKMIWAITTNGHRQPFDPEPLLSAGRGDRLLVKRIDDEPLALPVTEIGDGIRLAAGRHRLAFYRPHHATCPERDKFKGPRHPAPEPDPEGTPL